MKIALYGILPVLLYLAWTSHDKGEIILACVMIGAAGICYGLIKHESPPA